MPDPIPQNASPSIRAGARILAASNGWDLDTSADSSAVEYALDLAERIQAAGRTSHPPKTPRKLIAFLVRNTIMVGGVALGMAAYGNYRWHQGLAAGADTVTCLIGGQVDGWEKAMRSRACLAIKGKKPPYFPESLRPQGPPAQIDPEPRR